MDFLVTGARKAKPELSSHFKGMITLAILLLKFGENYMRKQGSSSPLPRKNHVKRMKIRIVKNVTLRQCGEKSKRK